MIVSYFTEIEGLWTNEVLESRLSGLPLPVRQRILKYTQVRDRQLRVCGKLLLLKALEGFYPDKPDILDSLQYNAAGKPFLEGNIDFNIAHSGNIAICAATDKGNIGIDIEKVKDIELNLFETYFTAAEWSLINNSNNPLEQFYTIWVRKEAVIKAIGGGIHTPLTSVDVCTDTVSYKGNTYYLHDLQVYSGYKAAIATTQSGAVIHPASLDLTTLSKLSNLPRPY